MTETDKLLKTIDTLINSINKTSLDIIQSHMLWVRIESAFTLLLIAVLIYLSCSFNRSTHKFLTDEKNKHKPDEKGIRAVLSIVFSVFVFFSTTTMLTKCIAQIIDPRLYYVFKVLN